MVRRRSDAMQLQRGLRDEESATRMAAAEKGYQEMQNRRDAQSTDGVRDDGFVAPSELGHEHAARGVLFAI